MQAGKRRPYLVALRRRGARVFSSRVNRLVLQMVEELEITITVDVEAHDRQGDGSLVVIDTTRVTRSRRSDLA